VLELERSMTAVNLAVAQQETVKAVYAGLPLHELKLVQLAGGADGGLASLLPGLAAIAPIAEALT
jgi:hypothetical protein